MDQVDLVEKFFSLEEELCKSFGYQHDWRIFPIVDSRNYYWRLDSKIDDKARDVSYAKTVEDLNDEAKGNYYQADVYTYRHLDKWVFRTEKYTMVLMDTHSDGNVFLSIFDNSKEVKES